MSQRSTTIGYTTGVFDLFHIGHLNLLKHARSQCDFLIVGVTTDGLVAYKGKSPVIPYEERAAIVESIRHVDRVVPQEDMDKLGAWERLKFHRVFVGDDWKGTEKWVAFETEFAKVGVDVVYFPYTQTTSSTLITQTLHSLHHVE